MSAPHQAASREAGHLNLAALFLHGKAASSKLCFITPHGSWDYSRLDLEVRRAASALGLLGTKVGDRVAIMLDDGLDLAVLFLACLSVGALPVVLNPNLDEVALAHVLRDSQPRLVFSKQTRHAVLRSACLTARHNAHMLLIREDGEPFDPSWQPPGADASWNGHVMQTPDQGVCIQYTSGSTGHPKGVLHSAAGLLAACETFASGQLGMTASDVVYSVPKAFFGYGMGNSLLFPLYTGATAVLDHRWPTTETIADNLARHRPTVLFAVPTVYRTLLARGGTAFEVHGLRLAFSAGAPLPPNLARAWQEHVGVPLHDGIGATELVHVFATSYPDAHRTGTLGRMVGNWEGRIVDAYGNERPPGEIGVLMVRSPAQALGYWKLPEETTRKFVHTDDDKTSRWYRTGDLFSMDQSGLLRFHGREDDRFKVNGRWVSPVEIENVLAEHAPELGDCYLVAGEDMEGEPRPVLFIHRESSALSDAARHALNVLTHQLDRYKLPVRFEALAPVPLTANGKLDRRALAARATSALSHSSTTCLAPETLS